MITKLHGLKMKISQIFFVVFTLVASFTSAQQATFLSQSELGISVGQMYYIGDLNPFMPFNKSQWATSYMYRYNLHSRMALRVNYLQGSVEADDKSSSNPILVNRNLNFHSDIKELAA